MTKMSDYITLWKTLNFIPVHQLAKTNKTIQEYSIAGLRNNFFVLFIQPDLMLDTGISAPFSPKYICKKSKYYSYQNFFPIKITKLIDNYIVSMFQLSDSNPNMIPHGMDMKLLVLMKILLHTKLF